MKGTWIYDIYSHERMSTTTPNATKTTKTAMTMMTTTTTTVTEPEKTISAEMAETLSNADGVMTSIVTGQGQT